MRKLLPITFVYLAVVILGILLPSTDGSLKNQPDDCL